MGLSLVGISTLITSILKHDFLNDQNLRQGK